MDFRYRDYFNTDPSTGYETLVYDCMIGDPILFQRADSVESNRRRRLRRPAPLRRAARNRGEDRWRDD